MTHIFALLIVILGLSKYLHIRFMGLAFAQKTHEGLGFGHILRKFTSLKEDAGENFPNTGREIVSARQFKLYYFVVRYLIL